MIDVDANVTRVDLHLDVVGKDRQHLNARERGLAAPLGIGGRDSHEAVHALLRAKHAVGVLTRYGDRGAVDADYLCGGRVVDRHLPAAAVAVAQVHVQQHPTPVLRLEATLTRRDVDDGVALVKLASEPARQLELREVALKGIGALLGLGGKVLVARLLGKLVGGLRIVEASMGSLDARNVILCLGEVCHGLARRVGIVPKARLGAPRLEVEHGGSTLVDVKVTLDFLEPRHESGEALTR